MSDEFGAHLDHLLHIARERISQVDNATTHVDALTERYQILASAIDGCVAARQAVGERVRAILLQQIPKAPAGPAVTYNRAAE